MSNGVNQIGIPKFQHPWRPLQTSRGSGTWGDRGKGNELQSALEKGLSWIGDKFVNGADYLEDGFNYLVTAPLAAVTGKTKEIPRVIDQMREQRHSMSQNYAMNPVFDLVSPIKGGWMLKGLMKGSPLEKQLSKAGTISINGLQAHLNKASKLEQDVIGKILNTQFAGQKNIDYNALRKAVSDNLITYSRNPNAKSMIRSMSTEDLRIYGADNLGIIKTNKQPDGAGGTVTTYEKELPVTFEQFTFESPRIARGDDRHYSGAPLGHSRTYTNQNEPNILYVMESQSDWAQNGEIGDLISKRNKYLQNPQAWDRTLQRREQEIEQFNNMINTGINDLGEELQPYAIKQIQQELLPASIEKYNKLKEVIYPSDDLIQQKYLSDNYIYRQLQENMKFAAERDQSLMRYPTRDTAIKIEGFKKVDKTRIPELKRLIREALDDFESGFITEHGYRESVKEWEDEIKRLSEAGEYSKEHETILKKYSDFPKIFDKLFKGQEVRTATDPKGNTWYEVDIPENFLQSEWQFKKGGVLGLNKIIGL